MCWPTFRQTLKSLLASQGIDLGSPVCSGADFGRLGVDARVDLGRPASRLWLAMTMVDTWLAIAGHPANPVWQTPQNGASEKNLAKRMPYGPLICTGYSPVSELKLIQTLFAFLLVSPDIQ